METKQNLEKNILEIIKPNVSNGPIDFYSFFFCLFEIRTNVGVEYKKQNKGTVKLNILKIIK